jgi:CheY-like chemotaxis protein
VDSTLGKGSTFRVRLPATSRSAAPAPAAAGPPPPVAGRGRGRVLVMDDEEAVRAVVSTMLRRLGYDVQLSEDGNAAIETYMQAARNGQPFDLVLMDLTIPGGKGGKETLARLRSLDPKVRAVVSSGYSNDPVMANYRDYGFHAVLEKPYRTEQLARVLQEVLGKDAVL